MNIIDCNVKKFGYNEYPLITKCLFCIFLLGSKCEPLYNFVFIDRWVPLTTSENMQKKLIVVIKLFDFTVGNFDAKEFTR